jgi:hypothetical protein
VKGGRGDGFEIPEEGSLDGDSQQDGNLDWSRKRKNGNDPEGGDTIE